MRLRHLLLLIGLGLVFGPAGGPDQLRGESGRAGAPRAAGHNSADLSARWKQLAGGAAVWRRADVTDPHQQFIFDLVADRLQCANGEITRDQFLGMTLRPAAARPTKVASAPPKAAERPAPTAAAPARAGRPAEVNDSRPGPSALAEFRRCDVNGDGLLSYDEMDETLRAERDKWDTNQDGFIDLAEFKAYFKARARQGRVTRVAAPRAVVGSGPFKGPPATDLPPNLPPWFRQYDSDGDGQIGLYEWKAAGRPVAQFEALDLNGDGFLTPDEVLASTTVAEEAKEKKDSPKNNRELSKKDPDPPRIESTGRVFMPSVISIGGSGMKIQLGK